MPDLNGAVKYISVFTYGNPKVLPARRCPLKMNDGFNDYIYVTGDEDKNSIITIYANSIHRRWLIPNFEEHFPVLGKFKGTLSTIWINST